MSRKRTIGIMGVALVCMFLMMTGHFLSKEKVCKVLDGRGKVIAKITYKDQIIHYDCKDGYEAYIDLAFKEAFAIVGKQEGLNKQEIYRKLINGEMCIKTAFQQETAEALIKTCGEETSLISNRKIMEKAAAVSDIEGHLLACYSYSFTEPSRNYIIYPTYAGSTIKPVSVYSPAIDDNTICWSSLYQDSAYYQITNENGEKEDWPVNTHPYSNTMWTVQEALQKSNNAIAVKVLKDHGVEKTCEFLQNEFGMNTQEENEAIAEKGEDSVLSNLALGYLEEGVTMQEMMGAYQTFANGGTYMKMHTVTGIESRQGDIFYKEEVKLKQVFSSDTAYIMNRMMKTVVEEGGTGEAAGIEGMDICGKTGTSDDFRDNWFIGMTPEYVCAVWYENRGGLSGNETAVVFREIVEKLKHNRDVVYPVPEHIVKKYYCCKTGLLAGENCEEQKEGYYKEESLPCYCVHKDS